MKEKAGGGDGDSAYKSLVMAMYTRGKKKKKRWTEKSRAWTVKSYSYMVKILAKTLLNSFNS